MEELVYGVVIECLTEHLYAEEDYGKKTKRIHTIRELYIDKKKKLFFRVKVECDMIKKVNGKDKQETIRYYDLFDMKQLAKENRLALEQIMEKFGKKVKGLANLYYLVFDHKQLMEYSETETFQVD